jgi:acetyltransferase-like isoleucine patch superfamily enzyme
MSKLLVANIISKNWKMLKKRIIFSGYNDETIASYFRKQGARVGEHCRFEIRSLAHEPYFVSIGNHVFIATGVILHTHDGGVWIAKERTPEIGVFGTITIEDNCIIGVNAQILPNVRIGSNSIVGAGSVVISDIPPNSIAMGIPARVIGSTSKYEEKCLAIWKEQRPPDLQPEEKYSFWYTKENQNKIRMHLTNLFIKKTKGV